MNGALCTYDVEGGHGVPELEVLVVQAVGVVGPGPVGGGVDPPRPYGHNHPH